MKILDQLIESMGEAKIFQRENGSYGIVVDPVIVETLDEIRTLVDEMENILDRITDDGK